MGTLIHKKINYSGFISSGLTPRFYIEWINENSITITTPNGDIIVPHLISSSNWETSEIYDYGDYIISDGELSITVTVDDVKEYHIIGKPDGSTVLPTDDIGTWLLCSNITDKSYTTLSEVLEDSATLMTLINDHNAVDYMKRSKSWASNKGLVPQMTSNTTPSGVCSASSEISGYEAYYAFDNIISGSSNRWLAQGTGASLIYQFPSAKCVKKVTIVEYCEEQRHTHNNTNIFIKGSNDGNAWSPVLGTLTLTDAEKYNTQDIILDNNNEYTYYGVFFDTYNLYSGGSYCGLAEVQFYPEQYEGVGIAESSVAMSYIGLNNYCANTLLTDSDWNTAIQNSQYFESVDNAKTPTMTSDNTPSGECISSTYLDNNYKAWKAFDGVDQNSLWGASTSDSYGNAYLGYMFTSPIVVKKIRLLTANYASGTRISAFKLQGYNGSSWVNIGSEITGRSDGDTSYIYDNSTAYEGYRVLITNGSSGVIAATALTIATLQFYGRVDV